MWVIEILFRLLYFAVFISTCYSFREKRLVPDDCGVQHAFTAPSGIINSHAGIDLGHHYGKGMRCTWHIEAPAGWYVALVADTFELDASSSSCSYDYLALYDGPYLNSTYLGRFCGRSFLPISSTGNYLTLQFITNTYNQYGGFKLYYNFTQTIIHSCRNGYFLCTHNHRCVQQSYRCDGDDDCGDDSDEHNCPPFSCSSSYFPCVKERRCISTNYLCDGGNDCTDGSDEIHSICKGGAWKCGQLNYTSASGTLQSPNYPSSYPATMACKFEIFAPNGTKNVSISFSSSFSIETDVGCAYDYLKIYAGNLGNMHGPYCGTKAPPNFVIPGDHVIVEFNSDGSDTYTGFQLHWSSS